MPTKGRRRKKTEPPKPPGGRPPGGIPKVSRGKSRLKIFTLPRGFEPPRDSKAEAEANISRWLSAFAGCMEGHRTRTVTRLRVNRDLSIDAQTDVDDIPRNIKIRTMLMEAEECFDRATVGHKNQLKLDYFIQGGLDFKDKEARESADRRYRGLNRYMTYWYRASNMFDMFQGMHARNDNVSKRRGRAYRFWVRFHWNVANISPASARKAEKKRKEEKKFHEGKGHRR